VTPELTRSGEGDGGGIGHWIARSGKAPDLIADVYRVRAFVNPDGPGGVPAVRFEPGLPTRISALT
jgi:hypothetical protein